MRSIQNKKDNCKILRSVSFVLLVACLSSENDEEADQDHNPSVRLVVVDDAFPEERARWMICSDLPILHPSHILSASLLC